MSNLSNTIKNFTPAAYRKLTIAEINNMMDNNIPFKVSKSYMLDNNFNYCLGTQTLYKNDEEILLTKLEKKLLHLLIIKDGEIVNIDIIKNTVWKGKDMSIYTLRNMIMKIRDKTYPEIIKNKSNCGYSIWQM